MYLTHTTCWKAPLILQGPAQLSHLRCLSRMSLYPFPNNLYYSILHVYLSVSLINLLFFPMMLYWFYYFVSFYSTICPLNICWEYIRHIISFLNRIELNTTKGHITALLPRSCIMCLWVPKSVPARLCLETHISHQRMNCHIIIIMW